MSSDPSIDPRLLAVLDRHRARGDEFEKDLHAVLTQLEMEHYFAESCAAEEFLRDQGRAAIRRGETPSAKFYGVIADTFKKVREARFPDIVKALKTKTN